VLAVVAFIVLVYAYSLLSQRLEGTILTIPLAFTLGGIVLILAGPELVRRDIESPVWLILAGFIDAIALLCWNSSSPLGWRRHRSGRQGAKADQTGRIVQHEVGSRCVAAGGCIAYQLLMLVVILDDRLARDPRGRDGLSASG
jgi:hypothetical protein